MNPVIHMFLPEPETPDLTPQFCPYPGCKVDGNGVASACGDVACPRCGVSPVMEQGGVIVGEHGGRVAYSGGRCFRPECGHTWTNVIVGIEQP